MNLTFGKLTGTPEYVQHDTRGTLIRAKGESGTGAKTRYEGTVESGILSIAANGADGSAQVVLPLSNAGRLTRWAFGLFGKNPVQFHAEEVKGQATQASLKAAMTEDVLEIRQFVEENPPEGGFRTPVRSYASEAALGMDPLDMGGPPGPWRGFPRY